MIRSGFNSSLVFNTNSSALGWAQGKCKSLRINILANIYSVIPLANSYKLSLKL